MHIQMARELGLNPKEFGKLANHRQEPWKRPLPDFIAHLYVKRFGKVPNVVRTIEEVAVAEMAKREARATPQLGLAGRAVRQRADFDAKRGLKRATLEAKNSRKIKDLANSGLLATDQKVRSSNLFGRAILPPVNSSTDAGPIFVWPSVLRRAATWLASSSPSLWRARLFLSLAGLRRFG